MKNYWNTKLKKKLASAAAGATNHLSVAAASTETEYSINSKFDNNMLPYFPNSYEEILDSQLLLPSLVEAPENAGNGHDLAPPPSAPACLSADPHHNINANGSCEDDDAFFVEFMPYQYDLLNAFDFQEVQFNHQISHLGLGFSGAEQEQEQLQQIYQSFTY